MGALRAIKKGNFQEQFGIDVDCYVLDDEQKTPVVSKRGMVAGHWPQQTRRCG